MKMTTFQLWNLLFSLSNKPKTFNIFVHNQFQRSYRVKYYKIRWGDTTDEQQFTHNLRNGFPICYAPIVHIPESHTRTNQTQSQNSS